MLCKDKDIKELLPAYVREELAGKDLSRVKKHVCTCADCAREADLLHMMASEPVPDPGDAFWSEMPGRVYRALRRRDKKSSWIKDKWHELLRGAAFSRLAWIAATAGIVLIISWFIVNPMVQREAGPASGDEYSYDDVSGRDPGLRHTSSALAELTSPELDAVNAWAATELSSLAVEAGSAMENTFDTDLSEDLADMDSPEVDRLSNMLNELEEG